jgi:hypothetical protein
MVLEEMEASKNIAKKPELRTYKSLLVGYLRSDDMMGATSLVLHMVEVYTGGRNVHAKLTQYIFSWVTESWIKNGDLINSTMFANKMRELYLLGQIPVGPGLKCYKTLQSAWQRSMHTKRKKFLAEEKSHIENLEIGSGSSAKTSYGEASPAASSAPTFLEIDVS